MANKAVFFDRDNTLIEDPGYINSPDQVKLLPGVATALIQLRESGYELVVITNQSGIARGIVSEAVLKKIHNRLNKLLEDQGAYIDKFYFCPYHPKGAIGKYRKESKMRKPNPGMILKAAEEMDIDCSRSWMVGDSYRDVAAGKQAGCKTILIKSSLKAEMKKLGDPEPNKIAINLKEVVNIIKMYDREKPVAPQVQQSQDEDEPVIENPPTTEQTIQPPAPPETVEELELELKVEVAAKPEPIPANTLKTPEISVDIDKTNMLLEDVARYLKRVERESMFDDFSAMKIAAWVVQFFVLVCLSLSLWYLMDAESASDRVQTSLAYAIVLQLMVIAFCMMRRRK